MDNKFPRGKLTKGKKAKAAKAERPCFYSHHPRWRSIHGSIKCAICSPPANDSLVAERLAGAEEWRLG